jgi:hypothetical protein
LLEQISRCFDAIMPRAAVSCAHPALGEVGTRHPGGDTGYASDCDLIGLPDGTDARRDGTPYPEQPRRSG